MIYADHALAHRLEGLICTEWRRLAEVTPRVFPHASAECVDLAGGVALWLGEGSPVNLAVGLGMNGPVDDAGFERLEAFYHERGAAAITSICPLADPSLLSVLGRRGWRVSEFEHLLVLELSDELLPESLGARTDFQPGDGRDVASDGVLDVHVCLPEERAIWARVATLGFADGEPPERAHEEFGLIMAERDDAILVLAWIDGEPVGVGSLVVDDGVGWLSGDSTLPGYRRRGVQQAIQRHRLRLARDAGCDLAVTEAAPGGVSQRNMERLGFRIAYTHVEFVKPSLGR